MISKKINEFIVASELWNHASEIRSLLQDHLSPDQKKTIQNKVDMLAARIVALAALQEGENSPIYDLLKTQGIIESKLTNLTFNEIDRLKVELEK
ncbi:hypothetical protein B488_10360 [Liberibacter crescens BT-1]|uniref:Uncharacterized protein n=1 Tax=Liberibacter crescens (strain BT-1) TaxID=1215343 RepID=L0EWM6_LIBCB|nr:hypothetical protein [Liberibacter crescens]AGA65028.1 hypothetical protein B488_10360 [Liberibacter crescens BT-1]AMC13034.1 hypothetical protein RL73_05265 [Liberibacter crescens]